MSNFEPNAILRGAQLTVVGALRAIQNPKIFTADIYKQAILAVGLGIAIRFIVAVPIYGIKALLWLSSFFVDFDAVSWDDTLVNGLTFFGDSVLQLPFLLMTLLRYITPTFDRMFMDSLEWVDYTYHVKHQTENRKTLRADYFKELQKYPTHGAAAKYKKPQDALIAFAMRYAKRATLSLLIYLLSYIPIIGRLALPAASFYTFNQAVGPIPATAIFGAGFFLPRKYLVLFLTNYFASRSLMRELLEPYFKRIKFVPKQKRLWFRDREGVLFGFALGFSIFLKIPLLGVLIYGLAEASTAYLITKITDPPPSPEDGADFAASQVQWKNKQKFLKLPLGHLDALNVLS